jgi:hypothetical protein
LAGILDGSFERRVPPAVSAKQMLHAFAQRRVARGGMIDERLPLGFRTFQRLVKKLTRTLLKFRCHIESVRSCSVPEG